jgi:HSP20 family protein
MSDIKKKSFFERLTGSMRVNEDEMFDHNDHIETKTMEPAPAVNNPYEKTIKVSQERDPFEHAYVEEEEEEGELPIDVYQTDSEIIIQAFVAGVRPDELQISITRDTMTLKGKRQVAGNIDDDEYFIRELYWGTFSRTVELPAEVEPEEAEAVEKHGLIIIKLPKIDKQKRASIRVKSI